jgi:RNA polymerase sigma-70 factor (ECF subfamily)
VATTSAEHESSSESLMQRYQRRLDAGAFEEIVSRFLGPALGVARQLLWDRGVAEDAVQETFLRIVRRRDRYDASRPFSAWFYTILRNVCTDMLRRRARQERVVQEAVLRQDVQGRRAPPSSGDALDLLAALPEQGRAVLTLRVVEELPFRDVAAALGISEEAAKKRAQRALKRLRMLARDGETEAHKPARANTRGRACSGGGVGSPRKRVPDEAPRTY